MSDINIPEPVFLDRLGGDEIYGFGQDGDVTLTANTTLSRDMYYDDLTINSGCLLYTSPSPRDVEESRMPSSA